MEQYKFDPEKYGFEPVANFPELNGHSGTYSFVKVTAINSVGTKAYWYHTARKICHDDSRDDRWEICSNVWSERDGVGTGNTVYCGVIGSDLFAASLLMQLCAACSNDSIMSVGVQRYKDRTMNAKRLG